MVTIVYYIVGGRRHFALFLFSRLFFGLNLRLTVPANR